MKADFETDIKAYSHAGFKEIEIWLPKLEEYLKKKSLKKAQDLLRKNGLKPVAACYQGDLMLSLGKKRKKVLGEFHHKLEVCNFLEIPILVVPSDFPKEVKEEDYQLAGENLKEAGEIAKDFKVSLAIEFIAGAKFLGSLGTANKLINKVGLKNVGIVFDTFHFFAGISKDKDLQEIPEESLFLVHFNDVPPKPRELLTDKDRLLPGDGIIPLKEIIHIFEKKGYSGFYSLELFNQKYWEEDPYLFVN